MGIPRFAAWLTKKFPPMARRDAPANVHGLYIDMNGIIHPCCHSEEDPAVAKRSDAEKIEQVCLAVGNLVETAKPTHVLFLAMDGVAPRAKMNQQRARRYMSAVPRYGVAGCADAMAAAAEGRAGVGAVGVGGGGGSGGLGLAPKDYGFTAEEHAAADADLKAVAGALDVGIYGSDVASPDDHKRVPNINKKGGNAAATTIDAETEAESAGPRFDSNCISPGTVFMRQCSDRLKTFVAEQLAVNPQWKGLAVVVSDTNVPGEGEHKIIDFIRTQMGYGTSWAGMGAHVIHGNDADLILLCLGLHIPRVVICRENYRSGTHSAAPATAAAAATPNDAASPVPATEDGNKSASSSSSSDSDAEKDAEEKKPMEKKGGRGRGGGRGGGGRSRWPPRPRFEWFDIDIVGSCVVTELYDTSRRASAHLASVPDYQTYVETLKAAGVAAGRKKIVVGAGGVGKLVDDPAKPAGRKGGKKDAAAEKEAAAPYDEDSAVANNHATFLARSLLPTDPETGLALYHPCTAPCNHRVIDDFFTLATLMGNDFMPRLPSCFCGDSAMDNILEVYMRCVLPYGFLSNPLTNDVDLKQLHRFLAGYARVEATLFRQHCIKTELLTPAEAMSLSAESLGGSARGEVRLPSPIDEKWRSLYYSSTTIGSTPEALKAACASYVEGMRFVLRYYSTTSRTTSWSWFFPFHHSPFAADLANFIEPFLASARPEEALPPPKLELVAPLPVPQLMAILPPTSAQLLPAAIGAVMRNPPAALAGTFPSEWKIDYTAADGQEHLAAVLLPFADFKVLVETAEGCSASFTEEEKDRNVNNPEQCVLIHSGADNDSTSVDDGIAGAKAIIEGRVRGGINFVRPFTGSNNSSGILEFSYVDVPSRFYNKNKVYSANFKAVESLAGTGESLNNSSGAAISNNNSNNHAAVNSRDEKNAKQYKRRSMQTNASDVSGYRYNPPKKGSFFAPAEKGWAVSLADFHLGAGALASFVAFFSTVTAASTAPNSCVCSAVFAGISNAITTAFVFAVGSIVLCFLGVGVSAPRKESGIKRNSIRDAYVDWMCNKCLSLNFSRNEKCFTCGHPCDEAKSAWAVFTNKIAHTPAHLEPCHKPYVVDIRVQFPTGEAAEAAPIAAVAAAPTPAPAQAVVSTPVAAEEEFPVVTAAEVALPKEADVSAPAAVAGAEANEEPAASAPLPEEEPATTAVADRSRGNSTAVSDDFVVVNNAALAVEAVAAAVDSAVRSASNPPTPVAPTADTESPSATVEEEGEGKCDML